MKLENKFEDKNSAFENSDSEVSTNYTDNGLYMNNIHFSEKRKDQFDMQPFKLSVITSSTPLRQEVSFSRGMFFVFNDFREFEATVEVIDCYGLPHLKRIIENLKENQALVPSILYDGKFHDSAHIEWRRDYEKYVEFEDIFAFDEDFPSLKVFEVRDFRGSAEEAWSSLSTICSQLADVAYLSVRLPTHGITNELTGDRLFSEDGYRFYCVVRPDKDDFWYFTYNFESHAQNLGFGIKDHLSHPFHPTIWLSENHSHRLIMEADPVLSPGLVQNEHRIELELHPGELVDTGLFAVKNEMEGNVIIDQYLRALRKRADILGTSPLNIHREFLSEYQKQVAGLYAPPTT